MRPLLAILLSLWILAGVTTVDARLAVPEGSSGATNCTDRQDNDLDGLGDTSDPDCAATAAFAQLGATGVYAAEAEDARISGPMTAVLSDPLEPMGPGRDYLWVPTGAPPFEGQAVFTGAPVGTYTLHILARFLNGASGELWVKSDTAPFSGPPSNADADILNNRVPAASPTWFQLGRMGSSSNYAAGIKGEPERALVISTGQSVYLMLQAGLQIDCIALRPVGNTNPITCPSGGSGGGAPNYTVKQWSSAPTVDGLEDALWSQADAVAFSGTGSTAGPSMARVLWKEGSPDRICYLLKMTLPGLTATTTTEDDSAIFSDTSLDARTRYVDLQPVRDANTYTLVVNAVTPTPTIYDRNDSGGSSNPTFDLSNLTRASTYAANILRLEACHDVPTNVTAGQSILADLGINEKATGVPLAYKLAHCTATNLTNPACWGTWELSATVIGPPADTTAPVVGIPACTPNQSGAVCVAAITEADSPPVTCRAFRDSDNDGEVTTDAAFATTSCGSVVGGNCTCTFTGLSDPSHEMQIEATDAAGNIGLSAITDFSLTAPSGETFYMAASGGNDSNPCTTGSRCATFAGVVTKAAFGPGDTIVVGNGTYTTGFVLNCASQSAKFNGTSALRITLRAENERQAHIIPVSALNEPFSFQNCSYWTVEGFYFKGLDSTAAGAMGSPANFTQSGTNIIFRRNVVEHNNQCINSNIYRMENVTDSLIEDNEFLDFNRNGIGAGSRNLYRRNYANSRGAVTPNCGSGIAESHDQTRGDDTLIIYSGQTNLDMLFENNVLEDAEGGVNVTGGSEHQRIRFYGNISRVMTVQGFAEVARDAGTKRDNHWEHNLSIGHKATGIRARGTTGGIWQNNSAIAVNQGLGVGNTGFSFDMPNDGYGTKNFTWSLFRNLSVGHLGSGFTVEHPVSNGQTGNVSNWELRNNNSFGNGTAYNPSSGGTITNANGTFTGVMVANTSVNPVLGDALICIPTTSPMHASQRADGLQIGASILYQYQSPSALQPGTLTTTKLWSTSKGAGSNCPNSTSGWYPAWLRPCIAGVNDIPGISLYDSVDRIVSRNPATVTAVLQSCVSGY